MNHPHILTIVGVSPSNQRAPAGDAAAAAARLARLCRGTAQLEALTQQMDVEATGDTGGASWRRAVGKFWGAKPW